MLHKKFIKKDNKISKESVQLTKQGLQILEWISSKVTLFY